VIPSPTRPQSISANVLWNFGGQVAQALAAVICIPFLVRYLGLPRVGLLSLIWVLVGYLSILDLGLGQAVTKTVSDALADGDPTRVGRLYRTATRIQMLMGVSGALLLALATNYLITHALKVPVELQQEARISLYLCALAFPSVLLASSATGMLQAAQRFDLINMVQVPVGIAQFVLPLICTVWSNNLAVIVAVLLMSRVIALVLLIAIVRRVINIGEPGQSIWNSESRLLVSFGGWVTVSQVASPLMVYADRFLVGALQSVSMVAYYAVPSDAILRFLIVPRSIVSALFPVLSSSRDKSRVNELALRALRYILLLVGLPGILLFVLAHEVLTLWMGPDFASHSTLVLQILLLGIVANCAAQVPYALIQASGRADITAKIHLFEIPIYVAIGYFVIKTWGIEGAATVWSLRLVTESAILFEIARRRFSVSWSDTVHQWIPQILVTLLLLGISGLGVHAIVSVAAEEWILGLVLSVMLVAISWTFFLTISERQRLLTAPLPRISNRLP
jgi:O-antigen/teichoic acid export membrane protein